MKIGGYHNREWQGLLSPTEPRDPMILRRELLRSENKDEEKVTIPERHVHPLSQLATAAAQHEADLAARG